MRRFIYAVTVAVCSFQIGDDRYVKSGIFPEYSTIMINNVMKRLTKQECIVYITFQYNFYTMHNTIQKNMEQEYFQKYVIMKADLFLEVVIK